MPVTGADLVAKNIAKFGDRFLSEVNKDMEKARNILDKAVYRNISIQDHTLSDLAGLGHPYARRAPQTIHDPAYQVHVQSGELRDNKYSGTEQASIRGGKLMAQAFVGINERVRHAFYVVYGTSKMIPRDFLIGSLSEVRDQIYKTLKGSLGQAVVSFNGETQRL